MSSGRAQLSWEDFTDALRLASLVELGVLEPYSTTRYDRLYWNRRVFQVIEG